METTTSPIVRPATAGRVSVTFPGSLGYDTATVEAVVVDQDDRSMDLLADGVDLFAGEPALSGHAGDGSTLPR